jgi:hypothetical protein
MPVERIHPGERFLAPFARKRSVVRVQLFVPLAIVLSSEALSTAWPMAKIRFLLVV